MIASAIEDGSVDKVFAEKPFLGVPFTIKDCFSVKGMSWTVGLTNRANAKGDHDADCVRAMKDAGAIIMAITNVSELCLWFETNNHVYGRTLNPYHRGRIVGGSSGGEGCVLASAGSVMGIGSDVGGSIREDKGIH
jgi:fatty acid amide hydrolase 2